MWQQAKNQYHLGQALLANLIYWFPSRKLRVIGVTGTDGKTTTANLIFHILSNSGKDVSLISTIGATIKDKSSDIGYHVTTPGRFALQSYLRKSKNMGVEYVVLELTSHALDQYRAFGIPVEIGVLTNVSNEHLDYHKTYDRYVDVKARLLKAAKTAIINKDDKSYERIMNYELGIKERKMITYGLKNDSDVNPDVFPFETNLIGKFNLYNCLAAISVARQIGIPDVLIRDGIKTFSLPKGRQEIVYDNEFKIINDFAHTPNSFLSVLPEIKKITNGRLIHVFGAAGERDKYKRSEMGKISAENADVIILTSEDPRSEDAGGIMDEIELGTKSSKRKVQNVYKIKDRREAILFAVSIAKKGDIVLLTGKGHEKSMNYGRGEEEWNESAIALKAIEKITNGK